MKVAIILFACVAAATAQGFFNPFAAFFRGPQRRPQRPQQQQQFRPQQQQQPQFQPQPQQQQSANSGQTDDTFGNSNYHYSWRHDGGQKYTGQQAAGYCQRLGGNWRAISIESSAENNYVERVIQGERLEYIWTGATRAGNGWRWPSGGGFSGIAWSHTGGAGSAQPDNREQGGENCMAILNNFYSDGVRWHDVACHHLKPVICEQ